MSITSNNLTKIPKKVEVIRASGTTHSMSLASKIVLSLEKSDEIRIEYFGANATNVVNKAVAIARGQGAQLGFDIWSYPIFRNLDDDSLTDPTGAKIKTGMTTIVTDHNKIK